MGFKRDKFRNLEGGGFKFRSIKIIAAAPGLTMNLIGHEEFECDKDAANINHVLLNKYLMHQKNFLNLNKNYNELFLKLLLKHIVLKTTFHFHFIVNA